MKTILFTGATDGIGRLAVQQLSEMGHRLLVHGRSQDKLDALVAELGGETKGYRADLSDLGDAKAMAQTILDDALLDNQERIDVIVNNAGVYKMPNAATKHGIDARFVVNTLAPYLQTKMLLPLLPSDGRIVNLSSAAQAPVDLALLRGKGTIDEIGAYAQSKLAITMWTNHLAAKSLSGDQVAVSVNPASLLATKMVKEGFGVAGSDVGVGADILIRAALSEEFADASGKYYDNDYKRFARCHPAGQDPAAWQALVDVMDAVLGYQLG